MTRSVPPFVGFIVIAIFAVTIATIALSSNPETPNPQSPALMFDASVEESGSLEFIVSSVIGRALNVPGTY